MASETFKFRGTVTLTNQNEENIDNVFNYMEHNIGLECYIDHENNIQFESYYTFPSTETDLRKLVEKAGGGILDYDFHDSEHDEWGETHHCNLEITV